MRFQRLLSGVLLVLTVMPAVAFERPFPPQAKRGTLSMAAYPQVTLNGKLRTLSSGARIWSQENLSVIPNALGDSSYIVNYTEDPDGTLNRVWLLSSGEAAVRPATSPTIPTLNN